MKKIFYIILILLFPITVWSDSDLDGDVNIEKTLTVSTSGDFDDINLGSTQWNVSGSETINGTKVGDADLGDISVSSGVWNVDAGATSLTDLSDVSTASVTAGMILVADGTDYESVQFSATDVPIADSGTYYTGTEVEAALQEIGAGTAIPDLYLLNSGDTGTGDYVLDGALIVNEAGADKDVRMESVGNTDMFFLDASENQICINCSTFPDPDSTLTVQDGMDLMHTATSNDDHAFEIELDAAGYGDVKALDIAYITGAISAGEDEGVILINIDEIDATGGEVFAIEVLTTDGSANITGLKVGALVNPVHQDSGVFINPTTGTDNTTSTDVPNMIDGASGTTTAIFENDNEYILIGNSAAFEEIEFIITTSSSVDIKPTFGYSVAGSHQFTTFSPIDGTNGFRNTGVIAWDADDLTSHTTNDDTGTYDIKITRTKNNIVTTPILGYAKTASTTEYLWDKDGDVNVLSLEAGTITESGNPVYNGTEVPGGELGGTFASFTVDSGIHDDEYAPLTLSVVLKSAPYTLTDSDDIVNVDTTATITLHAIATARVKKYTITNIGNGQTITVDGNGAEAIDGETTQELRDGMSITITPNDDSTAWFII